MNFSDIVRRTMSNNAAAAKLDFSVLPNYDS